MGSVYGFYMQGKPANPDRTVVVPRCFKCGTTDRKLRRALCAPCYEQWLLQRPIGVGAACLRCGDRRRAHLRHFELVRGFVVLCHNCVAEAAALAPLPRSAEGLLERLSRERREGERRQAQAPEPGANMNRSTAPERRRKERRVGARDLFDATDLVVEEIEDGELTGIRPRV